MSSSWNTDRAKDRIKAHYEKVRDVTIVDYTKDIALDNIPVNKAYRMHAAHVYVDIVNFDELLGTTDVEGTTCHKRVLKFLNLHYRAVHRILKETDTRRVDFHNERLHAVVVKPYDDERMRVARAVAIADLISRVLKRTGDADESIPNASVRVGIDTGEALVVNNGRRGSREPMFLGRPANHAAKCASAGTAAGIYLTNEARKVIGLTELKDDAYQRTPLTADEISVCVEEAGIEVTEDQIVEAWLAEEAESPLGDIEFSRPTPPLRDLDIHSLSPEKAKRFDGISVYADIDGFTAYVDAHMHDNAEDVVRTLHVLRAELDAVVSQDFDGRRIRFIGDCIHGLLYRGTALTIDLDDALSSAVLCAGALRSSFNESLAHLSEEGVDVDHLGLAIGFDYGWISVSRLGMKGQRTRCAIGRSVLSSEEQQERGDGRETAIGAAAYKKANDAIQELFTDERIVSNLTYAGAIDALSETGDRAAGEAISKVYAVAKPAAVPALVEPLRPYTR
jgi:class 3 adenylate cyclase